MHPWQQTHHRVDAIEGILPETSTHPTKKNTAQIVDRYHYSIVGKLKSLALLSTVEMPNLANLCQKLVLEGEIRRQGILNSKEFNGLCVSDSLEGITRDFMRLRGCWTEYDPKPQNRPPPNTEGHASSSCCSSERPLRPQELPFLSSLQLSCKASHFFNGSQGSSEVGQQRHDLHGSRLSTLGQLANTLPCEWRASAEVWPKRSTKASGFNSGQREHLADRSNAIVSRARSFFVAFWHAFEIHVDAKHGKIVAALARHSCSRPTVVSSRASRKRNARNKAGTENASKHADICI